MKNQISRFSFKEYSLYVGSVFIITAIVMCGGEFYFGSLEGDLARLGGLPERDFGWQEPQPLIQAKNLHSYPLAEADVLVIGDSFSASLVWQSQLVLGGLKPSTLHWSDVKLCDGDFGEVVRQSGFRGRYVIIEAVERTIQGRMRSICKKGSRLNKSGEYSSSPPPTSQTNFLLKGDRLGVKRVIEAIVNKFRYTYQSSSYKEFDTVRMILTEGGCSLFSNRMCNYGLYYFEDFSKETFKSVDNVLSINKNIGKEGMQTIWLVVPDKSTIYIGYGKYNLSSYVNVWEILRESGDLNVPNLGEEFIKKSRLIKDFYAPNNTHLSPNGYLFLGDLVLGNIQKTEQSENKLSAWRDRIR